MTIKPFLPEMTPSELHCVMTSGMATIAGSVLFAYIKFNISASHLLSEFYNNMKFSEMVDLRNINFHPKEFWISSQGPKARGMEY